MQIMHALAIALQAFVAASIFFVWVVRYQNIIREFQTYRLPEWLRDFVGILKLTGSILLLIGIARPLFAVAGGVLIALLMACAFAIHLRVRNPFPKMVPCLSLLIVSAVIALLNYQLLQAAR